MRTKIRTGRREPRKEKEEESDSDDEDEEKVSDA